MAKIILKEDRLPKAKRAVHCGTEITKSFGDPSYLGDRKPVYRCSNCGERMDYILVTGEEAKGVEAMWKDLVYRCKCSDKWLLGGSLFRYPRKQYPFLHKLYESGQLETETSSMIRTQLLTYNEENEVLSVSESGSASKYIHGSVINKGFVNRVSFNFKTGDFYRAELLPGRKKMSFAKGNWSNLTGTSGLYDHEYAYSFMEEAIKRSGLPITAKMKKDKEYYDRCKEYRLVFKCGDVEVIPTSWDDAMTFILNVIANPNIFIRYDGYTGKASFRKENMRSTEPFSDYWAVFRVDEAINIFLPTSKEFRRIRPMNLIDEGEYIKMLVEKLSIPNSRQFMKMYRQNPMTAGFVHRLMQVGFEKPDNIRKMMDIITDTSYISRREIENAFRFMKLIVKKSGETACVKKSVRSCGLVSNLNDAWRMYRAIKKAGFEDLLTFKGNTGEIHDEIMNLYNEMDLDNKEIQYSRKEQKRLYEADGYEVRLAEDTHRLTDIGQKMHICVGSYGPEAVNKKCTIYYFFNKKEDRYAGCIEMRGNRLIQAKGYCNHYLEGGEKDLLLAWVRNKEIDAEKCHDYLAIAS